MPKAYMFNKRRPILSVDIDNGEIRELKEIIDEEFLPISLQENLSLSNKEQSVRKINEWLKKRKIPDKREGFAITQKRFPGFDTYTNMFSLSDQYWFQYKSSENWDDMNFFTNRYDEAVGDFFFLYWTADKRKIGVQTPELTTNGVLTKRWIQDDDLTSYLIKAGSTKYRQEPLSEVLSSLILQRLDIIPFVKYDLVVHGLKMCSRCKNFITADTEFVPAMHIYKKEEKKQDTEPVMHFIRMCEKYGIKDVESYLNKMIAADKILKNDDRHFGNFGFLRSAETGKILGFAPIFDNGRCFYSGKVDRTNTHELFGKYQNRAMRETIQNSDIKTISNLKAFTKLISVYPNLTGNEKINISAKVTDSISEVNQIIEQAMQNDGKEKKKETTKSERENDKNKNEREDR